MLKHIPTLHPKGMNSFFDSIESRLTLYENLKDTPALLELAIWKSKITEQHGCNIHLTTEMKIQCRTDSLTMVNITVPNVMSFLADRNDSNCVVDVWSNEADDFEIGVSIDNDVMMFAFESIEDDFFFPFY